MCLAGAKVIRASAVLKIPSLVTEQNPKALGATVPELGLDNLPKDLLPLAGAVGKTLFSMMVPEVVQALTERNISSVVIFGIEVRSCAAGVRPALTYGLPRTEPCLCSADDAGLRVTSH